MKFTVLPIFVSLAAISSGPCTCQAECKVSSYSESNSCPAGWTKWEKNCYRFYNQPRLSFSDAENFCAQFVPLERTCPCQTAHLVTIESSDENNFLHDWWKSMREITTDVQYVSIGYTDSSTEATWKWIDGSPTSYTGWDNGQPDDWEGNQDCATMWKTSETSEGDAGRWDDVGCGSLLAFICKFHLLD